MICYTCKKPASTMWGDKALCRKCYSANLKRFGRAIARIPDPTIVGLAKRIGRRIDLFVEWVREGC